MQSKSQTVDEYIASFPEPVQVKLKEIRKVIKEAAPEVQESISYGMPAFKLNGPLVYFAGYAKHIGFYPVPSGIQAFKKELATYIKGKGTAQFPIDKPIPYDLVKKITKFRVEENLKK